MPNARFIPNNAADRAASIAATNAVASLPAAFMLTEPKAQVLRTTGTTTTITLIFSAAEQFSALALSPCSLTSAATIAVTGFTETADVTPVYNSGTIAACPANPDNPWNWGSTPAGANAYAYGGGNTARVWASAVYTIKKLVIVVNDPGNPAGYLEISRIFCGQYFELAKNVDWGAVLSAPDTTKNSRNDSSDLVSELGTRSKKMSLPMSKLWSTDRNNVWAMSRDNGMSRSLFVSLYPGHADPWMEAQHQMICKLVTTPAMAYPSFSIATATLELEST